MVKSPSLIVKELNECSLDCRYLPTESIGAGWLMFSYRVCLLACGITTSGRIRQYTLEINVLFLWECPEPGNLELSRVSFGIFFFRPRVLSVFLIKWFRARSKTILVDKGPYGNLFPCMERLCWRHCNWSILQYVLSNLAFGWKRGRSSTSFLGLELWVTRLARVYFVLKQTSVLLISKCKLVSIRTTWSPYAYEKQHIKTESTAAMSISIQL